LLDVNLVFKDTNTYDYHLHIYPEERVSDKIYHGPVEQLTQLCPDSVAGRNGGYSVNITNYDSEDLHKIEELLENHKMGCSLELVLREHDD